MKLPAAAKTTATSGESNCVETTVAIEIAASCRPLRKSYASAIAISATSSGKAIWCTRALSGVIDDDAVDLVGDVLEFVGDALEMLVDFAPDHEAQRVAGGLRAGEIRLQAAVVDAVDLP